MNGKIAIIGATGNVGRKIVELFLQRESINPDDLLLFASAKSAGKTVQFGKYKYQISDTSACNFNECALVLFATDSDISRQYAPTALKAGCRVIDSSSAYRLDPNVPLIVSPVNAGLIQANIFLYAVANCLASPISVVLKPLHDKWTATRVIASTYQSTSGAGKEPMDELFDQTQRRLKGEEVKSQHFPRQIAFNIIPQVDKILDDGFSYEEFKIMREIQKIISSEIKVMATAVRVPVGIGHSVSLSIEFKQKINLEEAYRTLASGPGIAISPHHYSTPAEVEGQDQVFVGRIRKDPSVENGLSLWIVSDNLRRGAALDAVEVAEKVLAL